MATTSEPDVIGDLSWWGALHPPIYLISLIPGLSVFALIGLASTSITPLLFATLGVILLQHGINVLNDVTDWKRDADVEKNNSWVRFHNENLTLARAHGISIWLMGGVTGLCAIYLTDKWWLLWIATPLVVLGYLYNSQKKPISYGSFSELVTGLCYGPGVFGCLWMLVQSEFSITAGLGTFAFTALSIAVLLSHQPSQVLTDAMAGKQSFAVRYGARSARLVSKGLYGLAILGLVLASFFSAQHAIAPFLQGAFALYLFLILWKRKPTPGWILMTSLLLVMIGLVAELIVKGGLV